MPKHVFGEGSVSIYFDAPKDGRIFTAPSGSPESEFCWRLRYHPNKADCIGAASIIDTYRHLLEVDRKEADKLLGHLRACYRASKKWSLQ